MSEIVRLNALELQQSGVYRRPGVEKEAFEYSDGEPSEKYLHEVLSNTNDLSSRSPELQNKIVDWPSEYHLSSDRSNLLRGLELEKINTALEFGSGCGAISRYLGEQKINVEAIEGSDVRAQLGHLRCRDLDTVTVINANYNDLELPNAHYDLVLFIGVIEYAKKFCPGEVSDRSAAVSILKLARSLISEKGIVLVAIENRLGLKYLLGHHEDHYAKRYVGIHGYPESPGIATYSQSEWIEIIKQCGFESSRFSFPFPDYKIPRCILGEDYARDDQFAFNHVEGIFARDYTRPAKRSPTESIVWQGASQDKFLPSIANSFLIAMSNDGESLDSVMGYDFCHMPGPGRKNPYAMVTRKLRNNDFVEKIAVGRGRDSSDNGINQVISDQPYLHGNLLSTEWLRTIFIYARREEFDGLIARYYSFLGELEAAGEELKIDMLPINIVVDDEGAYQLFDQEWEVEWKISREYLLFRALLTFVVSNWVHMKDFLGWLELHTVRDFVDYGFRNHKIILNQYIDEFIELENRFQESITNPNDERRVEQLLDTVFDFTTENNNLYATLFWDENAVQVPEQNSIEVSYFPSAEHQTLEFELPSDIDRIRTLRIDPFDIRKTDQVGFFSISHIALLTHHQQQTTTVWQLNGEQEIANHCQAISAWYEPLNEAGFWMASTEFPKLIFPLGDGVELERGSQYKLQLTIRASESQEFIQAHQRYLVRMRQQDQLESDLKTVTRHLASARKELADIKAGKPFRLGMKIFSMLGLMKSADKEGSR